MAAAVSNMEITSNTTLKPRYPSHLNTLVPLTIFDQITAPYELPLLYTFRAPMPDNATLVTALADTLSHYPHLAGSFASDPSSGHPSILLDDTGVRVIQTAMPTTLDSHLPLDSAADLSTLFPRFKPPELSHFQLNRFACGGVAIAVAIHHLVIDACTLGCFIDAWSKKARGLDVHPLPCHDRSAILSPPKPKSSSSYDLPDAFKERTLGLVIHHDKSRPLEDMTNVSVHFSRDFLGKLKRIANEGYGEKDQCSTFQCLLAHLWKKVTAVRAPDVDEDVVTRVQFAVNGRRRVAPPLPMEYFGNFVLVASPRMKVGHLLRGSYGEVARVVREALSEVDDGCFKSFIGLGAMAHGVEMAKRITGKIPMPGDWLSPHMYNASFLGFGFDDLSFGGGDLCSVALPKLPVEGLSIFLPSYKGKGWINAVIGMRKDLVELFQEVSVSFE